MNSLLRRTGIALLLIGALLVIPAVAGVNGAVYTTNSTGTQVNGNIYDNKGDVYLTGGPQNQNDSGLSPDGVYYFQVTDPSGAVLLSTDDISCRQVIVSNGRVSGVPGSVPASCSTGFHALGTFNPANNNQPVQLLPYNDTPNSGGEYKMWLTPAANYSPDPNSLNCSSKHANVEHGFCDSDSKTDNFKIKKAGVANITVCKFNDWDANGQQNDGEPMLEHWPITATGVDGGTVNTQTGDDGCVSFSVSTFTNGDGSQTVTLQEGSEGPDWSQTAPAPGACSIGANCNVAGNTITFDVKPDDNLNAPNFGNANQYCPSGCFGNTLVVTKDANPSLKRTYTWGITKTVDQDHINTSGSATFNYTVTVTHDGGTDSDWKVTGNIRVANPTGADIAGITVSDALDNGGVCTISGGPNGDGTSITVPMGSHLDVPYTCAFQGAPTPSTGTNTATAAWDAGTQQGVRTFDFANAGVDVVDGSANITDSLGGSLGTVSATDPSPTTYNYAQTFTDAAGTCTTHDNTATFTTNNSGATGSASQAVTDCVGADLSVSKTATASFDADILKSVDKTRVEQAGGSATFNYTVKVTEKNWKVKGVVTVTNPNDWEVIQGGLTDVFSDPAGSCTVAIGTTFYAPVSSSTPNNYNCTFSGTPSSASGTNALTATWDSAAYFTPNGSASAAVPYSFQSLTVTDSTQGTLGTISAPTPTTTYTYSRTLANGLGGTCKRYDNSARIIETSQGSGADVYMCNTDTGALTIGFWQNKNGQGIITTSGPASGTCALTTWLRQFAPFQDLGATATCAQVGTYITNIIKAANASGSSMNAMLKAQMLSTALDVYFSNRIGAPTPIGSIIIDLTKVCNMLDGSGGTGACNGSYGNASSAFGGSPCMTVMDMLTYQNNVSNAGGSAWYGQNKAVQGLAKNAFDAINNRAAQISPSCSLGSGDGGSLI
jgi:hypothetical protein